MTVDLRRHECQIYQFWSNYLSSNSPSAVLQLTGETPVGYFNATASNRYRFGLKNGYHAHVISWTDRNNYLEDIHAVNTSLLHRQGRPMKDSYLDFPKPSSDASHCEDHYSRFIGCFKDGKLIAYITANFCGELTASSQIIGHGDHLKNGCMLVLWAELVRLAQEKRCQVIVYSRWSDGKDGLKYWKHSVGMQPITLKEKT